MTTVAEFRHSLRAYLRPTLLRPPPPQLYQQTGGEYLPGHASYSEYNYCGGGPVKRVKQAHFEAALQLARVYFGRTGAIDFGAADGFFLPTLARLFPSVLAVDDDPGMLDVSRRVTNTLGLHTVEHICNRAMSWNALREQVNRSHYGVLFLLETLEHVGEPEDMVQSRIRFLRELFTLVRPGGLIVISVPNMTGLPFAVQRATLAATGGVREEIRPADFARAVVLKNTDRLESTWARHKHLGFNHRKLEPALRESFHLVGKRDLFFSKVYSIEATD